MSKIRALVADDEPLARRGVRQLLAPHTDITVAGESRNGPETLLALNELKPDLLFLDVQMPEMDGLAVLRARGPHCMPAVIFVTAHDQFAVQAFEAHAIDYLVKPIHAARFEEALRRVRQQLNLSHSADAARRLSALLTAEREKKGLERIVVSTVTGSLVVPVAEIDWIAADDYYARLHVSQKNYVVRESLNALETRLDPSRFVRVHRGAIIQLDRVRELRTTIRGSEAILRDGSRIPVSRRRRAILEQLLRRP